MNIAFAGFRHDHIFGLYNSALAEAGVSVFGAFEEDDAARAAAEEKGVAFTYPTYRALLDDAAVEIVAVGDYYGIRGRRVIEALKAGKHVICDKPLCTSLSELDEIERLVAEKGLKVCVMLDLRYLPQVEKARGIIAAGELGNILNASFTGQHCLNYGKRPHWYFEAGKHGGTINDIAVHGIDLLRFLTGKNLTEVTFAETWNAFADKEPQFEDCARFAVKMGDMAVTADVSYAAPKCKTPLPTYWRFTLWGTRGMMEFGYASPELRVYRETEEVFDCPARKVDLLRDFLAEIAGEAPTAVNTADMLASQRQTLLIQAAADRGKKF